METFVGASMTVGAVVPVVAVTTAAGALVGGRTTARAVVVIFEAALALLVGFVRCDCGRHKGSL
jgi:hypothetical protein